LGATIGWQTNESTMSQRVATVAIKFQPFQLLPAIARDMEAVKELARAAL
jgi:hypothetical protein